MIWKLMLLQLAVITQLMEEHKMASKKGNQALVNEAAKKARAELRRRQNAAAKAKPAAKPKTKPKAKPAAKAKPKAKPAASSAKSLLGRAGSYIGSVMKKPTNAAGAALVGGAALKKVADDYKDRTIPENDLFMKPGSAAFGRRLSALTNLQARETNANKKKDLGKRLARMQALAPKPGKKLVAKPAAKPVDKPVAKKPSGKGFAQAFKEARSKFDAGTGNTTFKYNGSSYSVAKPAELKKAGGTYGKKLNDVLKSKQRRSETDKQVTNKPKSKSKFAGMPNEKMLNRLEREKTAKKFYGGEIKEPAKKKEAKPKKTYGGSLQRGIKKKMGGKVGKPKGVGCATRGYGKAMK